MSLLDQENIQGLPEKTTAKVPGNDGFCNEHGIRKDELKLTSALGFGKSLYSCPECRKEQERADEREKQLKARLDAKARQDRVNKNLENAMLAPRFWDGTLENYRVETKGQADAVAACRWFLANYRRCPGLIFLGQNGTGKNHLASAIVKEFIVQGNKTALMTTALKIVTAIKESWHKGESTTAVLNRFVAPELLVIDEVGNQHGTDTEIIYFTEIINDRYNWLRPTILLGNVTIGELKQLIGERALERFREGGRVVVFDWDSYRKRAANEKGGER